jgi:biofilm PGA synthesis protein PgaA
MRNRFGVGAEYQTPDLKVEGVFWQNTGDIVAPGGSLQLNWKPTDQWSFEAGLSQFAGDTPLRAIYYGTTANSATAGVTYAWDEARSVSAVYKPYNFSDGNVRQTALLNYSHKVIAQPTYNLTLIPSLYASTNTRQDVAYYSPSQDFAATLSARVEHIIYRRYETVFGGRLRAGVGLYQEANYSGGMIGDVSYEQFYRPDEQREITYGIGANHRMYDGVPENTFIVYLRLNAHF